MRYTLHFLVLLLAMLLQSCTCGRVKEQKYDIYRVEVGTYLNIRDTPSKKGSKIGAVQNGALVDVIEISDGWAKICYRGEEVGYVSSDYLVLVRQAKKPEATETPTNTDDETGMNDDAPLIAGNDATHRQEESDRMMATAAGKNVYFIGDSTILAAYEKEEIENRLCAASEYTYIVNTVENVPTDQLFDYAPDLLDDLSKELDSTMSWWQRFKSWFGGDSPSDHIVLISWIRDSSLLQAECNGNSLKYLKMSAPEKYFRLQRAVRMGAPQAISEMGLAIDRAGKEYAERSWFVRSQVNTGSIFNNICEDCVVENILPRDSFWHKWVLGWIFAIPLKLSNFIFTTAGSYMITLLIFVVIIFGLQYYIAKKVFAGNLEALKSIPAMISKAFLWLCMLSLLIYLLPDMSNIAVMSQSGFSEKVVNGAEYEYGHSAMTKNWILVILFIAGSLIVEGLDPDTCLIASVPAKLQQYIFRKPEFKKKFEEKWSDKDYDKYYEADEPFSVLQSEDIGTAIGKTISITLPISFVLSGSLLLFASIYIWTKAINKIILLIMGISNYKKQGVYQRPHA